MDDGDSNLADQFLFRIAVCADCFLINGDLVGESKAIRRRPPGERDSLIQAQGVGVVAVPRFNNQRDIIHIAQE